jgi:hypothetical protein
MTTEAPVIAAEHGHWYQRDGSPCYEVEAKKGGMRSTTLRDARERDLLPSVTLILKCAAAPGLENWKQRQLLMSALTLPKRKEETLDEYATRVISDSQEQGKKAAERGTDLHKAIEDYIRGQLNLMWSGHIEMVAGALEQAGIDLKSGNPERSFASPLGYGGKIDFYDGEPLILDFKTKERIENGKRLAWDEHVIQLSAYGFGLGFTRFRAANVFIGVEDKAVRILEHEWPELKDAYGQFLCLLEFWCRRNHFGKYAK